MNSREPLRSSAWFEGQEVGPMMARAWLRATGVSVDSPMTKPIIGICDTSSDLNPCNRVNAGLASAVATGVSRAGGTPLRFPVISIGEPFVKPTTMLLRNLMSMDVEESIRCQPVDAVVLLGGCDKTTPALIMGAASANVPAIVMVGGPLTPGTWHGRPIACGTDLRRFEELRLAGAISDADLVEIERAAVAAPGSCAVMGTASTMAVLAEVIGLSLSGSAVISANDPRRFTAAERAGERAVSLASKGPRPSEVLTRAAFENAITALAAIGGSTNAILHLLAIAGRVGVDLALDDFDRLSSEIPVIVDVRPAGRGTIEEFDAAGGVPALAYRLRARLDLQAEGVDGSLGERICEPVDNSVIRDLDAPVTELPWAVVLRGNLAPDGAVIKTCATSSDHLVHEGPAVVFDDRSQLMAWVNDVDAVIDSATVMVLRGVGPVGGPGMPEAGWWPVPAALLRRGFRDVVRISDGRMSGTAFGTVVVHVSPESAVGGPLALVQSGDRIRLDVPARTLSLLVDEEELASRRVAILPPQLSARGYTRLYQEAALGAADGCDFSFLRAASQSETGR